MRKTAWVLGMAAVLALVFQTAMAAELTAAEKRQFDRAIANFKPIRDRTSSREIFTFALEALEHNYKTELIEEAFSVAEQMQDLDTKSRTYGNFRWYWHNDKPHDRNAVEFSMEKGILIWMFHRDKLSEKARASLERLIRLSVEGIRRHNVPESYTNIFVMKTWNCIAIGENFGMPDLAEEGYRQFDSWLNYTSLAGIHEYLSPTYYGVDMPSLGLIANHAKRERERNLAKAALRLFWTDVALNWYEPALRLGGAHSRDYDYVYGHGLIEGVMAFNGFQPVSDRNFGIGAPFFRYAACPPPEGLAELMATKPRFVRQSWGPSAFENAAQYVGKDFSIGSAGACYGPMDKVLVVNLPGGYRVPVVSYLMDARGDPYGQNRFAMGSSGHSKALHIQPFVSRVQRGPEVLMINSIHPEEYMFKSRAPDPTCLLTHLVMPSVVTMYMGAEGEPVECVDRMDVGYEPFFIRKNGVVLGIRFLDGTAEKSPKAPVQLVVDGGRDAVMRLTMTHAVDAPKRRGTAVIWVRCAEGLGDAGVAKFRREFAAASASVKIDDKRIEATAQGLEGTLRLVAEPGSQRRVVREGEEADADTRLLAMGDKDFGREILEALEPVKEYQEKLAKMERGEDVVGRANEVIEAEAAMILDPFEVKSRSGASGGKYVILPNDSKSSVGKSMGRVVWIVHVPKDGTYYLAARVLAPTPEDDSFVVNVEQKSVPILSQFQWHTGVHQEFDWTKVRTGASDDGMAMDLKKGVARITFRCREDGTGVDAIMLTDNPNWRATR